MNELYLALRRNAEANGQAPAVIDRRQSLTWAELAAWVGAAADDLGPAPETVGILGDNGIEWVVAFLAATAAGKTIVPIPTFFSKGQREHLAKDASINRIIAATDDWTAGSGTVPVTALSQRRSSLTKAPPRESALVIYTSGSTGTPKGVRLASGQALWTAQGLAKEVSASPADRYLSVLPLPMLLEMICSIMIPVLVGGSATYDDAVARSIATGTAADIAGAFDRVKPTASVLVPQLLALYVSQLAAQQKPAPDCLRFVAVGGAPL